MTPLLTQPLALIGLAAIPALVAIYLLHRRPKSIEVSSLMLWAAVRRPHGGGQRVEPPRFPLSFWLELLIVLLLVGAAAGPMLPAFRARRPLIVILDDSLSMQAGSAASTARNLGRDFIERELLDGTYHPVRFILAGATPQVAGGAVDSAAAARVQLERWTCTSPTADLDSALALAMQLPERNALIAVITDAAPPRPIGPRIRWTAFGSSVPNVGFVAAGRWLNDGRDRVVAEVANFNAGPAPVTIRVMNGEQELRRERITLAANARRTISFDAPARTAAIDLLINDDAASFDNRVTLLPHRRPPARVTIDIGDERLRAGVQRAIDATGRAVVIPAGDIVITDRSAARDGPWVVQFLTGKGASHVGPFLIDRSHPLADGLGLDDVIWTAAESEMPGAPVITTGSKPLVTDETLAARRHHVRIALDPALSNLQKSPAWPALMWNLVEWRSASQPGFRATNVPLGSNAELVVGHEIREVRLTSPSGRTRELQPVAGSDVLPILSTEPGVWTAVAGGNSYSFASNALVPAESDLTKRESGEKSSWSGEALASGGYADVTPLVLLAALAIAAMHQRITAGARA